LEKICRFMKVTFHATAIIKKPQDSTLQQYEEYAPQFGNYLKGENGKLYDKPYGGSAVGRHEDGKVYDKPYGGSAVGSTERRDGSGYWLLNE
jgi:hypothetical protein